MRNKILIVGGIAFVAYVLGSRASATRSSESVGHQVVRLSTGPKAKKARQKATKKLAKVVRKRGKAIAKAHKEARSRPLTPPFHPPFRQPKKRRRTTMSAADKIKNAAEDLTGKAKEAIGNATNNDKLAAEGQADQVKADAKKTGEDVKDVFK